MEPSLRGPGGWGGGQNFKKAVAEVATVELDASRHFEYFSSYWSVSVPHTGVYWNVSVPHTGVYWRVSVPHTGVYWSVAVPHTGVYWSVYVPHTCVYGWKKIYTHCFVKKTCYVAVTMLCTALNRNDM